MEDRKDYIITFTGKKFFPLDPRVEDVDINDIANSHALMCRFLGHSTQFYSTAQHSVFVSLMCEQNDALHGLLHDASEAYLVDVPSPLKKLPEFEEYLKAEKTLMKTICVAFGLHDEEPRSVKIADKRMLATEARDLTLNEGRNWLTDVEPYEFNIRAWTPEYSRVKFLSRFHELIKLK